MILLDAQKRPDLNLNTKDLFKSTNMINVIHRIESLQRQIDLMSEIMATIKNDNSSSTD